MLPPFNDDSFYILHATWSSWLRPGFTESNDKFQENGNESRSFGEPTNGSYNRFFYDPLLAVWYIEHNTITMTRHDWICLHEAIKHEYFEISNKIQRFLILIHSANPQSRPVGIMSSVRTPFVHSFQNLAKQNKVKTMFATGETVDLAEWITVDTCLVFIYFAVIQVMSLVTFFLSSLHAYYNIHFR